MPMLRRRLACIQHITPHPSGKPDTFPSRGRHICAPLPGVAITALLHIWKHNNLLSIGVGTVLYMVLVQNVFV